MKTWLLAVSAVVVSFSAASAQGGSRDDASAISSDQVIGKVFRLEVGALPPPKATPAVSNGPLTVPFEAQMPKVPEGFKATLFAKLEHPRRMLVLPNGDIIVAEQKLGHLTFLRS